MNACILYVLIRSMYTSEWVMIIVGTAWGKEGALCRKREGGKQERSRECSYSYTIQSALILFS